MKRLAITCLILCVLTACTSGGKTKSQVQALDLDDKEQWLMEMVTEQAFVFDYQTNKTDHLLSLWVEKYEAGKLVEENLVELSSEMEKEGSLIFATSKQVEDSKEVTIHLGAGNEDGYVSMVTTVSLAVPNDELMTIFEKIEKKKTIEAGKELVLATIAHTHSDTTITSIHPDFYDNPADNLDAIKKYDILYVLKLAMK